MLRYVIQSDAPAELRPKETPVMALLKSDDEFALRVIRVKSLQKRYGYNKVDSIALAEDDLFNYVKVKFSGFINIRSFNWHGVDAGTLNLILSDD